MCLLIKSGFVPDGLETYIRSKPEWTTGYRFPQHVAGVLNLNSPLLAAGIGILAFRIGATQSRSDKAGVRFSPEE